MSKHRQRSSQAVRKYPRVHSENVFCNHPHRICMQDRLEGYEFCLDHILQDKTAPFKQCNFVSPKNGKRCTKAASKADKKDGYCNVHIRKAAVMRYKATLKLAPKDPSQELLDELDYYRQGSSKTMPDGPVSTISKIMDYASESDSDSEPALVDQTWTGGHESDAESGDSEQEDALRHAGVYTAEEVALITRDKLIRLQSLYINQFKRLQHLMKESRRRYLANLKKETSHGDSVRKMADTKDKRKLKELKAFCSYRKRRGPEALLHRKSRQRRILATQDYPGPVQLINLPSCTFHNADGVKCEKTACPLTNFCLNHINQDDNQQLFHRCSGGGGFCSRPAIPYQSDVTCILHTSLPPYQSRLTEQMLKKPQPADDPMETSSTTQQLLSVGTSVIGQSHLIKSASFPQASTENMLLKAINANAVKKQRMVTSKQPSQVSNTTGHLQGQVPATTAHIQKHNTHGLATTTKLQKESTQALKDVPSVQPSAAGKLLALAGKTQTLTTTEKQQVAQTSQKPSQGGVVNEKTPTTLSLPRSNQAKSLGVDSISDSSMPSQGGTHSTSTNEATNRGIKDTPSLVSNDSNSTLVATSGEQNTSSNAHSKDQVLTGSLSENYPETLMQTSKMDPTSSTNSTDNDTKEETAPSVKFVVGDEEEDEKMDTNEYIDVTEIGSDQS